MTNEIKNVPELRFPEFKEEWSKLKLGELAEIVRGSSPRPISDPRWFDINSDIGWLRISDVTEQNGKITKLEQKISKDGQKKTRVLHSKHLLLSIAATVGKPVINYVKTGVHDGFLIFLRPLFDIEFMYQWLDAYRPKWKKYGQPGSQVNLNSELVKSQKIYMPHSVEQKKISDFFSKLDQQIELEEKKLAKLEEQKKGYMQQIFSQKLRFKNEVGKNYSEWKHETLNELNCYFTDGNYGESYPKSDDMSNFEEGVAFLRGSNIKKGRIVLDNANYISREKHNELVSGHLYLGDIVIAVRGSLGAVGYVEKNIEGQNINSQLAIIRTLDTKIVSRFLIYYLMSNFGQKELLSKVSGTALKQLPLKQIKSFKTPLPENKEQDKISDFFYKLDKIINKQIKKIDRLKLRKKGFLQKMFV
ncbi:restriction endonuclease subunit S [Staphylococcus cohnii]|uniref:Restriction endonuclease subunit S n=1 Tax=Staphylococcus cohnii TaxID=29382 RepID=A0A2T4LRC6_9STAP|nr:restriction endonuclease subunit S [Staphylococcus cohnii]PTF65904.1 restriction endonuclease subunit S [Staphylococcus cohnii]